MGGLARGAALVLVPLALALAAPARAQSREDGAPAESLGSGDAVRASTWGPAAIYANPAGLMRVPVLVVEAAYSYLEGKDGHNAGVSLVDAKTNENVALGVGYSFFTTKPDDRDRDGHQVRIALATGYRSDDLALYAGAGARWLGLTLGKEDTQEGVTETDDIDTWTADIGLLLELDHRIRFAVVGQNLVATGTREAPRLLGFGLSFVFDMLDVGANLDLDLSDDAERTVATWGFGADFGVLDAVHLRAGFVRDEAYDAERLTFGLGWSNQTVSVDAGYATSLAEPTAMTISVSVRWVP
jgi:hypothetical protein